MILVTSTESPKTPHWLAPLRKGRLEDLPSGCAAACTGLCSQRVGGNRARAVLTLGCQDRESGNPPLMKWFTRSPTAGRPPLLRPHSAYASPSVVGSKRNVTWPFGGVRHSNSSLLSSSSPPHKRLSLLPPRYYSMNTTAGTKTALSPSHLQSHAVFSNAVSNKLKTCPNHAENKWQVSLGHDNRKGRP